MFETRIDYDVDGGPRSVAVGDLDGDGNPDLAVASSSGPDGNVAVLLGNGDGTLQAAVYYGVGVSPDSVAIGDLDGDGNPDLAVACSGSYYYYSSEAEVAILLGNGDGTFQESVYYYIWYLDSHLSVAIGDLDGDGNPDLAVADYALYSSHSYVSILLGNGDGTFQTAVDYWVDWGPWSVDIGDLDGDGNPDLVTANLESDDVSVLLGNGDGTFQAAVNYGAGDTPHQVDIGDLDGDGNLDLAVAFNGFWGESGVSVLLGNGDGTFQAPVSYEAGDDPYSVAIGDFDGDGNPDLAVANIDSDNVSILLGHGDGTLHAAVNYGAGDDPYSIAIGDLDGDGNQDLAVANAGGEVSVLLGNGDGTLPAAVNYGAGDVPVSVAIGDFDGDGHQDLAVANAASNNVSVLLGHGDGTFQAAVNYSTGESPASVAVGDLDGDGDPDLAVAIDSFPGGESSVTVLLGHGDGTFQAAVSYGVGASPQSVAIGDLDGDGTPDLAVANRYSDNVSVLLGNGDGTFQTAVNFGAGTWPFSVAIGDLDGDGSPDLAVTTVAPSDYIYYVRVLLGQGNGTFQSPVEYEVGIDPRSVAIGDLDGDGDQDLAVANRNGAGYGSVSVLLGYGDGTFPAAVSYRTGRGSWAAAIADLDGDGNPDLAVANAASNNVSVLLNRGEGSFQAAVNYGAGDVPDSIAIGDLDGDNDSDLAVTSTNHAEVSILLNCSANSPRLVTGPGPAPASSPLVRTFPPLQGAEVEFEYPAYGAVGYGVNVTCGNMDHNAADEVLTGAGPGAIYGPHVRGFRLRGTPLVGLNFLAYGTNKYGVNVAAGDLDGDGYDEIITGAGPGPVYGPHVRGWDFDGTGEVTSVPGVNFFAYGTPKWGVNVSAGDIDGDGYDEIVTGAGPGAVYGPHVRGWDVDGGTAAALPEVNFFAYGTLKFGVNVACGDVDGDGIEEIVTGAGPGAVFAPHVRGWNYDNSSITSLPGFSFLTWDDFRFGATVFAGADLNGDGRDEIAVGCGPDPDAGTEVKVFTYNGEEVSLWFSLDAFGDLGLAYGTNVAAGSF